MTLCCWVLYTGKVAVHSRMSYICYAMLGLMFGLFAWRHELQINHRHQCVVRIRVSVITPTLILTLESGGDLFNHA